MDRTALLIRCTVEDADRVRLEAERQRRTLSGYVLQIVLRMVEIDDRLFAKLNNFRTSNQFLSRRVPTSAGARTAILVRCSLAEGERIREAARRRDLPINAFVLQGLKRAWATQMKPPVLNAPAEAMQQGNSAGK
jgi:hypothetical protein